jgi:hypothetical protein
MKHDLNSRRVGNSATMEDRVSSQRMATPTRFAYRRRQTRHGMSIVQRHSVPGGATPSSLVCASRENNSRAGGSSSCRLNEWTSTLMQWRTSVRPQNEWTTHWLRHRLSRVVVRHPFLFESFGSRRPRAGRRRPPARDGRTSEPERLELGGQITSEPSSYLLRTGTISKRSGVASHLQATLRCASRFAQHRVEMDPGPRSSDFVLRRRPASNEVVCDVDPIAPLRDAILVLRQR